MKVRTFDVGRALSVSGLLVLSACMQEGDFGRPAASVWNESIDTTGAIVARARGEPSSPFPLTDDERTLRDRAWRFLMPAAPHVAFLDILANLARSRILPPSERLLEPDAYYTGLVSESFSSPYSRYRRLSEDANADGRLVPLFASTAELVFAADSLRLRSLPFAKSLNGDEIRDAATRVAENRCLVAWVRLETELRVARYRFALEHLVAEMPGREALPAERAIGFLDQRRQLLDPLLPPDSAARCGLAPPPAFVELAPPLRAKY